MANEPHPLQQLIQGSTEAAWRVRKEAFGAIRQSQPVEPAELVRRTGLTEEVVGAVVADLAAKGMARLDPEGRIVGTGGLSLVPSPHRLTLGGTPFYTWCALDAVGIPAALEEDASAITACPHCGRELDMQIRAGRLVEGPAEGVIWLPWQMCSSVADELCPDINLFCNDEHLQAWKSGRGDPPGQALSLTEAAEIGRQWWSAMR